jgi:hypothetical protein
MILQKVSTGVSGEILRAAPYEWPRACHASFRPVLPLIYVPAVMIEWQPVPVAVVLFAIFTKKRQVGLFTTRSTGLIQGIGFLLK